MALLLLLLLPVPPYLHGSVAPVSVPAHDTNGPGQLLLVLTAAGSKRSSFVLGVALLPVPQHMRSDTTPQPAATPTKTCDSTSPTNTCKDGSSNGCAGPTDRSQFAYAGHSLLSAILAAAPTAAAAAGVLGG